MARVPINKFQFALQFPDLAKPKASGLTIDVFYPVVVSNVPKVGEEIGKLLVYMVENAVIMHPDQIHILGFSLGAHVRRVLTKYLLS